MELRFSTPSHIGRLDDTVRATRASQNNIPRTYSIFFSPGEVWNIIRKLPNHRALGPDGVTNCALKHGGKKTIIRLRDVFNWCARTEHFPDKWKLVAVHYDSQA